ncbi:MAG: NTP transferase domain-containing protein, partial [Kosmotogaceae bacterium]
MKVLILAAGKGTLGKSNVTKPLAEVNGKPMIKLIVNKLRNVIRDTEIVVVVNEDNRKPIEDAFSNRKNIRFVIQPEALGTADALRIALDEIDTNEDLLVMYADTVLIREASIAGIISTHKLKECDITLLSGLTEKQYPYALVERDKGSKIVSVIDH